VDENCKIEWPRWAARPLRREKIAVMSATGYLCNTINSQSMFLLILLVLITLHLSERLQTGVLAGSEQSIFVVLLLACP